MLDANCLTGIAASAIPSQRKFGTSTIGFVPSDWVGQISLRNPRYNLFLSPLVFFIFIFIIVFWDLISNVGDSYWAKEESRRRFFDSFAEAQGFDPLVPKNWYSVSKEAIQKQRVFVCSLISYLSDYVLFSICSSRSFL